VPKDVQKLIVDLCESSSWVTLHRGTRAGQSFLLIAMVLAGIGSLVGTVVYLVNRNDSTTHEAAVVETPLARDVKRYPTTIQKPSGPPRIGTGMKDASGREVTVSCTTCHATRPANFKNKSASDLDEFHHGMDFHHGTVSCLSCHHPDDYDALKLADGTRIEFTEVMTLCAQCHGPQMKDYEHGTHGGMNGYWDTTRGPRSKKNCVDCHQPHAPQFPQMRPTFKPRDRFLEAEEHTP